MVFVFVENQSFSKKSNQNAALKKFSLPLSGSVLDRVAQIFRVSSQNPNPRPEIEIIMAGRSKGVVDTSYGLERSQIKAGMHVIFSQDGKREQMSWFGLEEGPSRLFSTELNRLKPEHSSKGCNLTPTRAGVEARKGVVINDKADGARYPVRWGLSLLSLPTATEEHGRPPKPHVTEWLSHLRCPASTGVRTALPPWCSAPR